ncbi:uncharacterized protein LOC125833888 [Solanum verrucosum]|uniref:uncharacterized protein LOC125833888 n=1 Tax=Solanum verrucosum TaxID=315347 RepID=UPI0020D1519B|nr:uncharacterized protein LOC125833888 [Solanum verrucosum]
MKKKLIPTRTVTAWRICVDHRKLNDAIRKDHYPVPFIDKMLDRLAGQEYYCFLDGYSGYNQILIAPEDQMICPSLGSLLRKGIVLGHKVWKLGLEVDKAKVEVIEKLPPPISIKGVRSFLDHAGFYGRFIKDFSKIAKPMCSLLEKEVKFDFDEMCLKAFEMLKMTLIEAPILIAPDWELPFELMCDTSDVAVGAVLRQQKNKLFHSIYYASKTLDSAQANYTVTEKEMLALVFAFDKFRLYLIKDRNGIENQIADHLSRLEDFSHVNEGEHIREEFSDEQLMALDISQVPWYADIVHLTVNGDYPPGVTTQQKKKLNHNAKFYIWDEPFLFKQDVDQVVRRCIPEVVINTKGWALFDVWGIDFMGPFPPSSGNQYILVTMDYVSKWVEGVALLSNDSRVVIKFIKKHIFTQFGSPRAIISDGELEHHAYWEIKRLNLDPELASRKRVNQLHELDEFRIHTYENPKLYKEKMKRWHNKHIVTCTFTLGENVLLFNSRLRLFAKKLRSKWSGPLEVVRMTQHGAFEHKGETDPTFLVNRQRVKHYFGVDSDRDREALELNDE